MCVYAVLGGGGRTGIAIGAHSGGLCVCVRERECVCVCGRACVTVWSHHTRWNSEMHFGFSNSWKKSLFFPRAPRENWKYHTIHIIGDLIRQQQQRLRCTQMIDCMCVLLMYYLCLYHVLWWMTAVLHGHIYVYIYIHIYIYKYIYVYMYTYLYLNISICISMSIYIYIYNIYIIGELTPYQWQWLRWYTTKDSEYDAIKDTFHVSASHVNNSGIIYGTWPTTAVTNH